MSALSPVAPGTPLRFAVDTDSSVPLEFKFIRYQVSTGGWTVIQDYSFRPVWSWTPTVGDLDDYYLQVWVRARGSTNAYDTWRSLGPFTIGLSLASIVSLTSDASPPIAPGTTITWTAAAHGGMLRLEYQFINYSSARARWEIVRDWSPDPVWAQTTTPLDEGDNLVIVAVKSWGGDNLEAVQEAHAVVQPPDDSYVLATRPPAEDLPGGQQVFFNAHTGGYLEASRPTTWTITATRALPDSYVSASMKSPDGGVPAAGLYENAEWRYADSVAGIPALDVNMTGDPCATPLTGKFRIFELEYDGGRTVARVAADIEQLCDDEGPRSSSPHGSTRHCRCSTCSRSRRTRLPPSVRGPRSRGRRTRRAARDPSNTASSSTARRRTLDDGARLEHRPSIHLDAVHERLWVPLAPGLGPHRRKRCRLRGLAKFRSDRRRSPASHGCTACSGMPRAPEPDSRSRSRRSQVADPERSSIASSSSSTRSVDGP